MSVDFQPVPSLWPYPWASTMSWSKSSFNVRVNKSAAVLFDPELWNCHLTFCRGHRSNTLKHSSLYEAFLPFLSPVLLFILSTIWVVFSPSNILELQPRIFYLMVGTAFANVTVSFCWFLSLTNHSNIKHTFKCSGSNVPFIDLCVCVYLSCSVSSLCARWVTHVASRWAGCCCPWHQWCC